MISTRTIFVEDSDRSQISAKRTRLIIGFAILCALLLFGGVTYFGFNSSDPTREVGPEVQNSAKSHINTIAVPETMNYDRALQIFYNTKNFTALKNVVNFVPLRTKIIIGFSALVVLIFLSTIIYTLIFMTTGAKPVDIVKMEIAQEESIVPEEATSNYSNAIIPVAVILPIVLLVFLGFIVHNRCIKVDPRSSFKTAADEEKSIDELMDLVSEVKSEIKAKNRAIFKDPFYQLSRNRDSWWITFGTSQATPAFKNDQSYTLSQLNIAYLHYYGLCHAKDKFIFFKDWSKATADGISYTTGVDNLELISVERTGLEDMDAGKREGFEQMLLDILDLLDRYTATSDSKISSSVSVKNLIRIVNFVKKTIMEKRRAVLRDEFYNVHESSEGYGFYSTETNPCFKLNQDYTLAQLNVAYHVNYGFLHSPYYFFVYKDWTEANPGDRICIKDKLTDPTTDPMFSKLKLFEANEEGLRELVAQGDRIAFKRLMDNILIILREADDFPSI